MSINKIYINQFNVFIFICMFLQDIPKDKLHYYMYIYCQRMFLIKSFFIAK